MVDQENNEIGETSETGIKDFVPFKFRPFRAFRCHLPLRISGGGSSVGGPTRFVRTEFDSRGATSQPVTRMSPHHKPRARGSIEFEGNCMRSPTLAFNATRVKGVQILAARSSTSPRGSP